ncbi:hypothetical protein MNB_SV-15-247 [hydrothermal vent metagenome]|uniref:Outer membrane protein beta-barrel domain-containing protein n=1 Tax=hydrothermal vent metagenome TaxID=652676 RepID=A0A1W1EHL9_9ZZZZ
MSYRYNNLAFSLSHSYYKIFDSRYNNLNLSGDYYLSSNYSIKNDKLNINYSLGLKIPNRSSDISTKEFDYFGFLNLNYNLNKKQNIYASYGYTLTGKSDSKNYSSLSIGSDYMLSDDWQISLTYNYNGSTYDNINNYRSISIGNYYKLSDKLFMKFRYDRGLDDNSYKNAFSLSLGAVFE